MASVFDLKTSVQELSSANGGVARMQYEQHPPTRDITGDNFPNGAIHTRFNVSGSKWWVPARSYMRMRCSLTDSAGTGSLSMGDEIAPNMGMMANLFQSGEFRIADKTLSRVSDYMAQVDCVDTRLKKSKAWLDSVGEASNMWESSIYKRMNKITSDGKVGGFEESPGAITSAQLVARGDAKAADTIAYDATGGASGEGQITFTGTLGTAYFGLGDKLTFDVNDVELTINKIVSGTVMLTSGGDVKTADVAAANMATNPFVVQKKYSGDSSRRVRTFELAWQPPLSVFNIKHGLPSGKYELVLNPQTVSVYKKRIIESLTADKVAGTDFNFSIDNMYFYVATIEGERADDLTYLLDLSETRCQVDTATGAGLQQKNFDVSPSSYALTLAFQDESAGQNTLYSASKFKVRGGNDLSLTRMYLNYAGQNKPQPDADPSYVSGDAKDYTTQRYAESILQSGSWHNPGGAESLEEWQERGPYYYFAWPRDGTDRSTRVNANFQLTTPANSRVLLFDHYKSVARITVQDGQVVDVQLEDA